MSRQERLNRYVTQKRIEALLPSGAAILASVLLTLGGHESAKPWAISLLTIGAVSGAVAMANSGGDEKFFERELAAIANPEIEKLTNLLKVKDGELRALDLRLTMASGEASEARQTADAMASQAVASEAAKHSLERVRLLDRISQLEAQIQEIAYRPATDLEGLTGEVRGLIRGWILTDLTEQLERVLKTGKPEFAGNLGSELHLWRQKRIESHWENRLAAARERLRLALENLDKVDDADGDPTLLNLVEFALTLADRFRLDIQKLYSCAAIANGGDVKVLSRNLAQAHTDKARAIELAEEYREQLDDLDGDVQAVASHAETIGQEYRGSLEALVQQSGRINQPRLYGSEAIHDHQRLSDWFALTLADDGVSLDRLHSSRTLRGIRLKYNYVGSDWTGAKARIESAGDRLQSQATAIQVPDISFAADETVTVDLIQLPPDPDAPVQWPSWVGTAEALIKLCLKFPNVRVSGGTEAGKSPFAASLASAGVKTGKWDRVVLSNPVSGLEKDDWQLPARCRTDEETLEALASLDSAIGGNGQLESESRIVLWDETNKLLKGNREAQQSVDNAQKTVSHLGERHIWIGQNPNVSASGQQKQDKSNYCNVVIGYIAAKELLGRDKTNLPKVEEIQRLADHENKRLKRTPNDKLKIRWAWVEAPDGTQGFYLLHPFTPDYLKIDSQHFDQKAPEFAQFTAAQEQGVMESWVATRKHKQFRYGNPEARKMAAELVSGQAPAKADATTVSSPFPGLQCPHCGNDQLNKMSDGRANCRKSDGGCGRRISPGKLLKA